MKSMLRAIAVLVVVASCGGLASSNGGDAGTDQAPASQVDSRPMDRDDVDTHDGATDSRVHDAARDAQGDDVTTDASACLGGDAASPWSSSPSGTKHDLSGVWGSGRSDAWAVGSGATVLHWNGSAWSTSPLPSTDGGPTSSFNGVWGSGPSDVWAVGGHPGGATIVHWDGAWSASPLPSLDGGATNVPSLSGVWGSGPTDVWAVGAYVPPPCCDTFSALIVHWDGSSWSASSLPSDGGGTSYSLNGVWGSGPSDVWAVGGTAGGGTAIVHWNGSAWSSALSSSMAGGYFNGIWGSGPNYVLAAGGLGATDEICSLIWRWNGSKWGGAGVAGKPEGMQSCGWPAAPVLLGIWGLGPRDVWAVGGGGGGFGTARFDSIEHWNGMTWSSSPFPLIDGGTVGTATGLKGIWGSGPCDVWAVGSGGTILHHS